MTTGCTLLFIGPSLPDPPVALAAHIAVRPPARCGDMVRALEDGVAAMALVDGVFETGPTTWHKEILYLLSCGIRVYGAASLGALRAAELDRFGMIGVGAIYEDYRDGRLDRDDAVMVLHTPADMGHRAVTVALVDAEASIAAAQLDRGDRETLVRLARRTGFRDRTWHHLMAGFASIAGAERAAVVAAALRRAAFSRKQRDVATLLDLIAMPSARGMPRHPIQLPRTRFLETLLASANSSDTRSPAATRPAVTSRRSRSR